MSKEFVQELDQALHDNSNFRAIKKKNDILEIRCQLPQTKVRGL